jgi:PAS domain S-box-containing protein
MYDSNTEAQHIRIALEASGIGTWQFDVASKQMILDGISRKLLGFTDKEQVIYTDIFDNVREKNRKEVKKAIETAIIFRKGIDIKYRTISAENVKARCVHVKGKAFINAEGTVYAGTVQDVTTEMETSYAQLESEYRYRSIIEEAPLATALYVGRDLVIEIANDVMLSYWGKDNSVIGMKLEEAVPELEGQPFAQILKSIFDTGEIYQVTEEPVDLALNGVFGTYYFDFTYKPLYNTAGEIYAIMNMAVEVTERVMSKRALLLSEDRYRSLIEEAPVATCLFVGRELKVEVANDLMLDFWGKDRSILNLPLERAVPELIGQPFLDILDKIYTTGETFTEIEAPAQLLRNGELSTYYFDYTYKPLRNAKDEVYAIMDMAIDVTERVISRKRVQQSEARFRAITEQSPMAIGLLKGRDMVIELGNDKIFEVWGKPRSVTGMKVIDALPEIKNQQFLQLLDNVYTTGQTYHGYDVLAKLEHQGELKDVYFDFIYSALRDENGEINGVLVIANDVTERVETLRKIAANEAKFRALMNATSAAMVLFIGKEEKIIDSPNQALLDFIGRDKSIIGRPLYEAVPEIKGSESDRLIQQTFETGETHQSFGRQVTIVNKGIVTQNYYDVTYTPLFDSNGNVYAVLDTAIDVTESIKARQAIEEAEASLRGAIELAELGTWSLDPKTFDVDFSERMLQWHGLDNSKDNIEVFNTIHERDRDRITAAVARALTPGSDGVYDEEYTIINKINGRERIIHAQGKAFFNEKVEPYAFMGTAQDITTHKQVQMALENEVKERTIELQAANTGLEEANRMLMASNEELAQYAYVASHDLQEPLRKIAMYSNLLKDKDTENKFSSLIEKIIKSSRRMSLLIKDLLEFSRLLNTDSRFSETDLNTIVNAVRDDFELLIQEKNAHIKINPLPVISAVPLQMNQLFYNLISNGLKFTPADRNPVIEISGKKAEPEFIVRHITNPIADTPYHVISVKDNGIGIEEQYVKQIFEVFKRLHGRDEYSGSGIGLAICRRITVNHNGAIFTESEVGKGTTFYILLPERQSKVSGNKSHTLEP